MTALTDYISERGLDPHDLAIWTSLRLELAFTDMDNAAGATDTYIATPSVINLINLDIEEAIPPGPAYDEASQLLMSSTLLPVSTIEAPHGSDVSMRRVELSMPCTKAFDLKTKTSPNEMFRETSSEAIFRDAKWALFQLTEEYNSDPCERDLFDWISDRHEESGSDVNLRTHYQKWIHAENSYAANGSLPPERQKKLDDLVEDSLDQGLTAQEIKEMVRNTFNPFARHRELYDVSVDEAIMSRASRLSL